MDSSVSDFFAQLNVSGIDPRCCAYPGFFLISSSVPLDEYDVR